MLPDSFVCLFTCYEAFVCSSTILIPINSLFFDLRLSSLNFFSQVCIFQVKCRPTPENLGVWRFKLAIWEVGGIKIERTRACNIFLCLCTEIGEKMIFLVKDFVPENFEQENLSGPVPTESCTQELAVLAETLSK